MMGNVFYVVQREFFFEVTFRGLIARTIPGTQPILLEEDKAVLFLFFFLSRINSSAEERSGPTSLIILQQEPAPQVCATPQDPGVAIEQGLLTPQILSSQIPPLQ